MSDSVPHLLDDIEVLYRMPDGDTIWWHAVIQKINVAVEYANVHAEARIVYVPMKRYNWPESYDTVLFLDDNELCPSRSKNRPADRTPWRHAIVPDVEDVPYEDAHVKLKKRKKDADIASDHGHEDRPSKNTRTTNTEPVEREQEKTSEVVRQLRRCHQNVTDRLQAIESEMESTKRCMHMPEIDRQVSAVRLRLLMDITDQVMKPIKKVRNGDRAPHFDTVLQRSLLRSSHPADLSLFRHIVQDIRNCLYPQGRTTEAEVVFMPSALEVLHTSRTFRNAKVVFRTAHALFSWLGASESSVMRDYVVRLQLWKAGHSMRILGGLSYDGHRSDVAINACVARSTSSTPLPVSTSEPYGTQGTRCLRFNCAAWNEESNQLVCRPDFTCVQDCDLEEVANDGTAFVLSWVSDDRCLSQSSDMERPYGIALGDVECRVPTIIVHGEHLCALMRRHLSGSAIRRFFE